MGLAIVTVHWLTEHLCFVSGIALVGSFALRNPLERHSVTVTHKAKYTSGDGIPPTPKSQYFVFLRP